MNAAEEVEAAFFASIAKARLQARAAARAYLAYLGQVEVQRAFSQASGQPARIESWSEPAADSRFNGFYSAITRTMAESTIRPRAAGYAAVEQELSSVVTRFLAGEIKRLAAVQDIWQRFC